MPEPTWDIPVTPETSGHCNWCQTTSDTLRLVQMIEQNSGPGYPQYACAACRDQHYPLLTPIDGQPTVDQAWRAYIRHTFTCTSCTDTHRCDLGQPRWDTLQASRNAAAVTS